MEASVHDIVRGGHTINRDVINQNHDVTSGKVKYKIPVVTSCHEWKILQQKSWLIMVSLSSLSYPELLDHNALTSIVSFNLPFFPPQELYTYQFLDL